MSSFDEREKGFEKKFERDQELAFKAKARRDKLLGLWAAAELGLSGAAAEAYAKDVVAADLERPGDDDVVEKVARDFAAKGVQHDSHRINAELARCAAEARAQLGLK
ncbi:MAG TPA: DUF1476 domain-containing protein [Stellaceae bacterium]|nr:DUF1476 domain-containing protein [Stellaceae bacterium]